MATLELSHDNIHSGLFHSDSNKAVMTRWLMDTEDRSLLIDHVQTMRLTEAIAISIKQPGYPVTIDFIETSGGDNYADYRDTKLSKVLL